MAACWGCEHKEVAGDNSASLLSVSHHNFEVEESGLFISTEYPFVGASPGTLVTCACCSDGICEIKVYSQLLTQYGYGHWLFFLFALPKYLGVGFYCLIKV